MKITALFDLNEAGFTFPRNLREAIEAKTKVCGISVLKVYKDGDWLDITIRASAEHIIIARFRLSDIFFVGYSIQGKHKWFTLREIADGPSSSKDSSSSSSCDKKIKTFRSIKDEAGWGEFILPFTGQYSGTHGMVAHAGTTLQDILLSKFSLVNAVESLCKLDPTSRMSKEQHALCALSCAKIPIVVSEAIRFEVLHSRIEEQWLGNGFKMCSNMETLIKNWKKGTTIVHVNMSRKDDDKVQTKLSSDESRKDDDNDESKVSSDVSRKDDGNDESKVSSNTVLQALTKMGYADIKVGQLKIIFGLLKPVQQSSSISVDNPSFMKKGKQGKRGSE